MKFRNLLLLLTLAWGLSACMTTRTSVGTYVEDTGQEYTYAKGKQFWLFYGIIPLGRTDVSTPTHGNCQVITRYTFADFLISGITGGILTSYTIQVRAKRGSSDRPLPEIDRY
jgi:hypothetical protein